MERFIVAEVSKNWCDGEEEALTGPICVLFERVINLNHQRGYRLLQFQLHQRYPPSDDGHERLIETIVAVFERVSH